MSQTTSQSTSIGPAEVINFTQIPEPLLVPGSYFEVVAGYQNLGLLPMPARTLIIGGMIGAGSATAGALIPNVTRSLDARGYGGPGSHIDRMCAAYLASPDIQVPLDIICLADAGGSAAAVWTLTFAGTATAGGTPAIAIEGARISIGTLPGDAATVAATEYAAAINAGPQDSNVNNTAQLPVTATVSGAVVTVTARNKGVCGNDISFVPNPSPGDVMPPGLTVTIVQTVQGSTNPSISAALALVATTWYTDIVIAWQDSTNQGLLSAEMERRFNAMVRLDARAHVGVTGSFSQQLSAAATQNERFLYYAPITQPGSAPWAYAAACAAVCAQSLTADPSRQLNQIALPTIVGPQVANVPQENEEELLLQGGCSVFHLASNGTVSMKRYVSTYTTNAVSGAEDWAWMDVMRQAIASRVRYDWRSYVAQLYPGGKLAPDGSLAAQNDPTVCTPSRRRASWAARMLTYAKAGWIVNETVDANNSSFVIDPNDPNRMNERLPITPIGNLIVEAGQIVMNVGAE